MRTQLNEAGIEVPTFASFNVAEESRVARLTPDAIAEGAIALAGTGDVDAIFLSCTNLDTEDARPRVTAATGLPCHCSNSVLVAHMLSMATGAPLA